YYFHEILMNQYDYVIPQLSMFYTFCSFRITYIPGSSGLRQVEEDDREQARLSYGKISLGRKKSQGSNIGDSDNTGDEGKTVGGAIGACGGICDSLLRWLVRPKDT
nr:hypothetical protein [Tanacetum cinerariifolium]